MNQDDLSLEKLKINERLHSVELQVARLVSHMESEVGNRARTEALVHQTATQILSMIERHDKLLLGHDGEGGILLDLDRVKQNENNRRWYLGFIWAAIATVAVSSFWKILHDIIKSS